MIYELAKLEELQAVYDIVQQTIKTIYPKYYPMEVVDFFCQHHSRDAIAEDIKNGYVSVLKIDGTIIATGSFKDNHITRVSKIRLAKSTIRHMWMLHCLRQHFMKSWDL